MNFIVIVNKIKMKNKLQRVNFIGIYVDNSIGIYVVKQKIKLNKIIP